MGWSFHSGSNRREMIEYLTREIKRDNGSVFRTVAQCCKGTVLYTVQENESADGDKSRFVCVYMLQNGGYEGWGYKDVDETMGPYQLTCPPKYFEIAGPTDSKTAQEWRDKCLAAAAVRKVKGSVKVGDTIVFGNVRIGKDSMAGVKAVVTKRKGRGIWVQVGYYDNVRVKVSHIAEVLPDGAGRRAAHAAQAQVSAE